MIELVIKISEKAYNALTHTEFDANLVVDEMRKAIANGTPLPAHHKRLIDADDVYDAFRPYVSFSDLCDTLDEIPTIIEADKE